MCKYPFYEFTGVYAYVAVGLPTANRLQPPTDCQPPTGVGASMPSAPIDIAPPGNAQPLSPF